MPQIPYQPFSSVTNQLQPTGERRLDLPQEAFGIGVAKAKIGRGEVLGSIGKEVFTRAMALQQMQQETEAIQADTAHAERVGTLRADYISKLGQNAGPEAYEEFKKKVKESYDQGRESLSFAAAKMYDKNALTTSERAITSGAEHTGHQMLKQRLGAEQSAIAVAMNEASMASTYSEHQALMQKALQPNMRFHAASGSGDKITLESNKKLVADGLRAWIEHMRDEDPERAKVEFETHRKELEAAGVKEADQLKKSVDQEVQQRDAISIANDISRKALISFKGDGPQMTQEEATDEARTQAEKKYKDPKVIEGIVEQTRNAYRRSEGAYKDEQWHYQTTAENIIQEKKPTDLDAYKRSSTEAAKTYDKGSARTKEIIKKAIKNSQAPEYTKDIRASAMVRDQLLGMTINGDASKFFDKELYDPELMKTLTAHDHQILTKEKQKLSLPAGADVEYSYVRQALAHIGAERKDAMVKAGIDPENKSQRDDYDLFSGRLKTAIEAFAQGNDNRLPSMREIVDKIFPKLIQQVPQDSWENRWIREPLNKKMKTGIMFEEPEFKHEFPDKAVEEYIKTSAKSGKVLTTEQARQELHLVRYGAALQRQRKAAEEK